MRDSVLLVGTVSNVSKKFSKDFQKVHRALNSIFQVDTYLVESDSKDNTILILKDFTNLFENFEFESLGDLQSTIPERIERIRYCRNRYVSQIRSRFEIKKWKYIVVADLDGMNSRLTTHAIQTCFQRFDWDVCLANQSGGYYDIFALRHPTWQPESFFIELIKQRQMNIGFSPWLHYLPSKLRNFFEDDSRKYNLIYSKMHKISPRESWIEVDSGFGGFAIYKPHVFLEHDYSKRNEFAHDSEHVDLHLSARSHGSKILINPKLINSGWNTYNLNRIFLIRQARRMLWSMLKHREIRDRCKP